MVTLLVTLQEQPSLPPPPPPLHHPPPTTLHLPLTDTCAAMQK